MDSLTNNLTGAQLVAEQTIADRVGDAQRRAQVHALRVERGAARRAGHASPDRSPWRLPTWALRLAHPAH